VKPAPFVMIVRYLLLDWVTYLVLPWAWAAFGFVIDVVIIELTPAGHTSHRWVAGLVGVFIVVFVLGIQSVARALPFGLALGVSRRTYFLGAASLAVALGVGYGLVLVIGQAVERATGGWGINMAYFRVPYILDGSWYLFWLTASITLIFMFAYGMWYGLIHRRGGTAGTVTFGAAQLAVLTLAAVIVTWVHGWPGLGHFFATITATGVTAVLAVAAAALLAGGFATIRRLAV
jgi:hypothetical protein